MDATWNDADELWLKHRDDEPERVADSQFVASVGR